MRRVAGGSGGGLGILNGASGNGGGYFKLDGKEGLLNGMGVGGGGGGTEKAD